MMNTLPQLFAKFVVNTYNSDIFPYLETPIFGVETVVHQFTPDSYGSGIREDSTTISLVSAQGKYFITTVR